MKTKRLFTVLSILACLIAGSSCGDYSGKINPDSELVSDQSVIEIDVSFCSFTEKWMENSDYYHKDTSSVRERLSYHNNSTTPLQWLGNEFLYDWDYVTTGGLSPGRFTGKISGSVSSDAISVEFISRDTLSRNTREHSGTLLKIPFDRKEGDNTIFYIEGKNSVPDYYLPMYVYKILATDGYACWGYAGSYRGDWYIKVILTQ